MLTIEKVKEYLTNTYGVPAGGGIEDEDIVEAFGQAIFNGAAYDLPEEFKQTEEGYKKFQTYTDGTLIYEEIAHHGGEGEGDQYWGVSKFTLGGESIFVEVDGWYASYEGSHCDDYSDWTHVVPKEVVKTEYVSV